MPDEENAGDEETDSEEIRDAITMVNFIAPGGESIITTPVTSFPYPREGEEIDLTEIRVSEEATEDDGEPVEEVGTYLVKNIKRDYSYIETDEFDSLMVVANIQLEETEGGD